jgi:hypothetical protein
VLLGDRTLGISLEEYAKRKAGDIRTRG